MRSTVLVVALVAPLAPAVAEVVELPARGDTSIVMVDGEWHDNAGQAARIRIKGNQHVVALSFDVTPIAGRRVEEATLVCHQAAETIGGVTISSIAVPWEESTSTALAAAGDVGTGWGYPGGLFPAVCGGNAFTLAHRVDGGLRDGTYHWNVPPDIVHALATGVAHGLAVHEHDADYGRNPTIYSREQSGRGPVLVVRLAADGDERPLPATNPAIVSAGHADAVLEIDAPAAGFAYEVTVGGNRLGQHNVPLVAPGTRQRILVRDLPATAAPPTEIAIVTLSRTGERSAVTSYRGPIFRQPAATLLECLGRQSADPPSIAATTDGPIGIGVVPLVDRYDAAGTPVGDLPRDYASHNALFDGREVRLTAAAGEVVGFQLLLRGAAPATVTTTVVDRDWRVDQHLARFVRAGERSIPDPLLPLAGPLPLRPDADAVVAIDLFVPFEAAAGIVRGEVAISDGRRLPMTIEVLPWALPRRAGFVCEMNGYGLPDRVADYEALQRVAYDHRTHVNILHYSHGTAAPGARKSNLDMRLASGRRMDNRRYDDIPAGATTGFWDDFAAAFGPVLDGSLFADGHRGPVPVPGFYLTFHESWPLNCRGYFDGNPDAYAAFAGRPEYAATWVAILEDFRRQAAARGWSDAGFQIYLNNKGGLDQPEKAPWILDEPTSFWDYRALQYFGELADRGRRAVPGVTIDYRVDISRPEFCRGQLAGRGDLWVVSAAAFAGHRRLVTDRIAADGLTAWVYGTSNHVHEPNRTLLAWALDAWTHGASGIVPWQTIDKTGRALVEADQLGLFIFDRDATGETVIRHTLRLKAYREAQQLVEQLLLLESRLGWTREESRAFVAHHVDLAGDVRRVDGDDAGTPAFERLAPGGFDTLRRETIDLLRRTVSDRPAR